MVPVVRVCKKSLIEKHSKQRMFFIFSFPRIFFQPSLCSFVIIIIECCYDGHFEKFLPYELIDETLLFIMHYFSSTCYSGRKPKKSINDTNETLDRPTLTLLIFYFLMRDRENFSFAFNRGLICDDRETRDIL